MCCVLKLQAQVARSLNLVTSCDVKKEENVLDQGFILDPNESGLPTKPVAPTLQQSPPLPVSAVRSDNDTFTKHHLSRLQIICSHNRLSQHISKYV